MSLPTGHDLDDINPEALLVETDESIAIFLGGASEPEKQEEHQDQVVGTHDSLRGAIALVGQILPKHKKPLGVDKKIPALLRRMSQQSETERNESFTELSDKQAGEVELADTVNFQDMLNAESEGVT